MLRRGEESVERDGFRPGRDGLKLAQQFIAGMRAVLFASHRDA